MGSDIHKTFEGLIYCIHYTSSTDKCLHNQQYLFRVFSSLQGWHVGQKQTGLNMFVRFHIERYLLKICFGKLICVSCYIQNNGDDLFGCQCYHCQEELPWISYQCSKSYVCPDCYQEAENENQILCQLCDGSELEPVEFHSSKMR